MVHGERFGFTCTQCIVNDLLVYRNSIMLT